MKKTLILLLFSLLVAACQTGSKEEQKAPADSLAPAELTSIEIQIEGMTCTGCENTVMAGIRELDGIQDVSASFEEGLAKVSFDASKTNFEAMKEKIEKKGYTVTGHSSPESSE